MQAVIMAGGKGTRLRELTHDMIPKPMVPINGVPLLKRQIECLRSNGIPQIIIVTGHLGDSIKNYFADDHNISFFEETVPLGSAGALRLLKDSLDDTFLLLFGDVLFDISIKKMIEFHEKKNALATLFVHPNSHPFDSDLVIINDDKKVISFLSKKEPRKFWYQNLVNAGIYILNKQVCDYIPINTKSDLINDVLSNLCNNPKGVYGYTSPEYIRDVGTVERLRTASKELANGYVASRNLNNKQKAIFIDRDGTLNKKNGLIYKEEQFELESYASEAIQLINHSGYLAIVITNQPVVARGLCSIDELENIHKKMETLLGNKGAFLDGVFYCPHHPDKGFPGENPDYKIQCECRKPNTGLIKQAVEEYNIDLNESWMIGDTTTDIQTGKSAGTHTALVLTGDGGNDHKFDVKADKTFNNLLEAVKWIIENQ